MREFIEKLRRRNVVRTTIAYVVTAWLVLQVLDTLSDVVGYPEWTLRFVLLVLALGLPVTVMLAWIYEVTPEGIRRESELEGRQPDPAIRHRFNIAIVALLSLAIGLAAFNWWEEAKTGAPEIAAAGVEKSIAVLPLTAFSSDANEQFFADGLADTLLDRLAKLKDIKVISRTSSFQYRDRAVDVREVGKALQVATVLEGSVQRSGNRLRIIAQLINTADGSHIWSKTFDRDDDDIFAIQDEIANAIVQSLRVNVAGEEMDRFGSTGTTSVEAYNLYTLALGKVFAGSMFDLTPEQYQQQTQRWLDVLNEALDLDPNYTAVYRTKSMVYNELAFQTSDRSDHAYFVEKGKEAALAALSIDPDDPLNIAAYGQILRRAGEPESAEVFLRMALRELPNDANVMSSLVLTLSNLGKLPEEQLRLVQKVNELQPNNTFGARQLGFAYLNLGRIDDAAELSEQTATWTDEPQLLVGDIADTRSYLQGDHVQAIKILKQIRNQHGINELAAASWIDLLGSVGLYGEAGEMLAGIENPERRARLGFGLAFQQGQFERAKAFADVLARESGNSWRFGQLCFQAKNFRCAVDNFLQIFTRLDTRKNRIATVRGSRDFRIAIQMIVSYRALGEAKLASGLMDALDAFVASQYEGAAKVVGGYNEPLYYLLKGDTARALDLVRERIERGDIGFVPNEYRFDSPAFEKLSGDPTFKALVVDYERRRKASGDVIRALL